MRDEGGSGRFPAAGAILVVEDDLGLAELIREGLAERGWECALCATGAEAIHWLQGHHPVLALLDYSLPDMTGAALIDRVGLKHFIVTTGAGDERLAVDMMKKGALDYLVKDGMFLETLPGVVELALHHIGTEQRLADMELSLRLAEEELVRARRMESLGLMAGGIAHDFNNLFQALRGNLELALIQATEVAVRAPLDRALKSLDKASVLTHRMLEFTGRGFSNPETLALNGLVQRSLEGLEGLDGLAGERIRFAGQEGLPDIQGDRKQLTQVVMGLVLNAVEAMGNLSGAILVSTGLCQACDPGPGVWIQVPPERATVCLSVADSGSGMSAEVLERAFEPFFTTRRPGRGLGLSAALGILRNHRCGLWVATAPGQGTTIRIHFPPGI